MQLLPTLLSVATLSALAAATTPILAKTGCANLASYSTATGTSESLFLRAWSATGNSSFELQGHGGQTKKYSENGVEWVIHSNPIYAQNVFQCQSASTDLVLSGFGNPWNPCSDINWYTAVLSSGSQNNTQPGKGSLALGNDVTGVPLRFYWHDVKGEGKLYLGRDGNTTWGVTKDPGGEFPISWRLRFVGKKALKKGEVPVFVSLEER